MGSETVGDIIRNRRRTQRAVATQPKKLLSGIIPFDWQENVVEHATHTSISVIGEDLVKSWYASICRDISKHFGNKLIEISNIEPNGKCFVIYLKK